MKKGCKEENRKDEVDNGESANYRPVASPAANKFTYALLSRCTRSDFLGRLPEKTVRELQEATLMPVH